MVNPLESYANKTNVPVWSILSNILIIPMTNNALKGYRTADKLFTI